MVLHIVGNRPQFIKLAPLYKELEKRGYQQQIIHSGQHYDDLMSDVFFKELGIPEPVCNLKVGSGTHGTITGNVIIKLESKLIEIKPEVVILYGDTDTTVGAALATSKCRIPIVHVEGGLRTGERTNPEEQNRIVTDHLSSLIFAPDDSSVKSAQNENLGDRVYNTGDIMYDTYLQISERSADIMETEDIILMTWHRQENTSSGERMNSILDMVAKLKGHVVCPMHPRTKKSLSEFGLWEKANGIENMEITEPVGYLDMVGLMNRAKLIVTDSGGLSKESSFAGVKCLFMLNLDVWKDLLNCGWIRKIDPESNEDVDFAVNFSENCKRVMRKERPKFYGDGCAAKKMVDLLEENGYI